ncbi:MAG: hypothetical protein WCK77_21080 [Verrucomicrobiota bacterium]
MLLIAFISAVLLLLVFVRILHNSGGLSEVKVHTTEIAQVFGIDQASIKLITSVGSREGLAAYRIETRYNNPLPKNRCVILKNSDAHNDIDYAMARLKVRFEISGDILEIRTESNRYYSFMTQSEWIVIAFSDS